MSGLDFMMKSFGIDPKEVLETIKKMGAMVAEMRADIATIKKEQAEIRRAVDLLAARQSASVNSVATNNDVAETHMEN